MIQTLQRIFGNAANKIVEKPVAAGYDAWAASYDCQPGNLVLYLDEQLVSAWLADLCIENRNVGDIGCGTGRHWQKVLQRKPAMLIGFDVSRGMLDKLLEKFPGAMVEHSTNDRLPSVPDSFFDILLSTLTLAHMNDAETAIRAWARVLKPGGELILTDFHPAMLESGAKRSFSKDGRTVAVQSHIYPLESIISIAGNAGLQLNDRIEKNVDESLKHFYEAKNAMESYRRSKDKAVIYGLRFKKNHASS